MDLTLMVQIATLASVIFAGASLLFAAHVYRRQMNAQLFIEFTKRYEQIMEGFPANDRAHRLRTDGDPPEESPELTVAVLKYLNLCSEEFYLWKRSYLSSDVWSIWEEELKLTLRSPLVRREWATVKQEFASYPEFEKYVEVAQAALR